MLRKLRTIHIVVAGLLLGACSSQMSYSEMQALMPPQPAEKGRIYFYRESAFLGNLITPDILVNGETVGTSTPGTFFYVDLEPGDYQLSCGVGERNHTKVTLAAGQDVYARTKVDSSSIVKSNMVTELIDVPSAVMVIHDLKFASSK
jgi:hypothetical protein